MPDRGIEPGFLPSTPRLCSVIRYGAAAGNDVPMARIAGPPPDPHPPLIGAVPVPRMDNIADHTARAWTALRVPMLPTLEALPSA